MMLIIFLYGLLLGSFFNVVGLRVPANESIVKPRSACPHCGKTLFSGELIPVLSYLIQSGKCRRCKVRISMLYPVIELATGLLFVFAYIQLGQTFEMIIACTIISLLAIISVSDISYMLIPNKILLVFAGVFFIERLIEPLQPWWDSLAGAAIGFVLLLLIAIVSKGAMGGGDIKLYAVLGFVLGTKMVLLSFFLATFIGAVIGALGMMAGKVKKGEAIPFGPFIAAGTVLSYFFHKDILQWYIGFL